MTAPRSHHERGQLFGTDGRSSWQEPGLWDGVEIISTYSRADALADGVLVDVSHPAREAGITFPVAMTWAAWCRTVELPDGYQGTQDETGRLWDVVNLLRFAIRGSGGCGRLTYRLRVVGPQDRRVRVVELTAACGPGDDAAPVITVMLPGED